MTRAPNEEKPRPRKLLEQLRDGSVVLVEVTAEEWSRVQRLIACERQREGLRG